MTISAERERQLLASVAYRSDALRAIQFLLARVRELEKREDELTAALQPFDYQARIIDENDAADGHGPEDGCSLFKYRGSYTALSLGDCRKAREALEGGRNEATPKVAGPT